MAGLGTVTVTIPRDDLDWLAKVRKAAKMEERRECIKTIRQFETLSIDEIIAIIIASRYKNATASQASV